MTVMVDGIADKSFDYIIVGEWTLPYVSQYSSWVRDTTWFAGGGVSSSPYFAMYPRQVLMHHRPRV